MEKFEKVKAAQAQFQALGMSPNAGAPPLLRLFWHLGIPLPPAVFWPPWAVALFFGVYFAAFWQLVMWGFVWSQSGRPLSFTIETSLLAGAAFGIYSAWRIRTTARNFKLPTWADVGRDPSVLPAQETPLDRTAVDRNIHERHPRFTKMLPCPHCGQLILVTPFSLLPYALARLRCPSCNGRSTLPLRLRMVSSASAFVVCMAILTAYIVALVASNTPNMPGLSIVAIASALTWMVVDQFIRFRFATLVKP